jgi:hypothetical protein
VLSSGATGYRCNRRHDSDGAPLSLERYILYSTMTFKRTLVALKVYRRLMDEGPTFGNSLANVQRWDRECLTAAVDVREAFWHDCGADPQTREACFSMAVEEVRRTVNHRSRVP